MIEDPKNAHIHKFIGDSNFDLVLGDPLEVASSLIAWKYDLPLAHNARWTLNGDAGQSKGLKMIIFHPQYLWFVKAVWWFVIFLNPIKLDWSKLEHCPEWLGSYHREFKQIYFLRSTGQRCFWCYTVWLRQSPWIFLLRRNYCSMV